MGFPFLVDLPADSLFFIPCYVAARDEAALDLFEYIEVVYNRARIHAALGDLSPAEFEEANWPEDKGRPKAA